MKTYTVNVTRTNRATVKILVNSKSESCDEIKKAAIEIASSIGINWKLRPSRITARIMEVNYEEEL